MLYHPYRLYRNGELCLDPKDKFNRIVLSTNLLKFLPVLTQIEIRVEDHIPVGTSLAKAHRIWQEKYLPSVSTPDGLPRQKEQALCPRNLVRLAVDCIEERNPGMGSYYGFTGYYLSVLVLTNKEIIWDARGERAT